MADDLGRYFDAAAAHLQSIIDKIPESSREGDLLYLYARYKQATTGACNVSKPSLLNYSARKKWMSWNGLGDMSCDVAKTEYVSKMRELDPSWNPTSNETRSGMGVSVSVMKHDQEKISDDDKNIFDWCREGSLKKVAALLPDETPLDDENRTLLHWACDRGHIEIVRHLIELGHDVNCQDYDKSTPLHYASSCDHPDIIRLLLLNNADASIADEDGEMPIHCSASDSIRKIFDNFTKDKI